MRTCHCIDREIALKEIGSGAFSGADECLNPCVTHAAVEREGEAVRGDDCRRLDNLDLDLWQTAGAH